jgi:nickel transport protein
MTLRIHLLCLFVLWGAGSAHAHALRGVETPGAMAVSFTYGDHEPAADTDVTVLAPGNDDPFFEGFTDAHGVFAFKPTSPGNWRVVMDDGLGHRAVVHVSVDEQLNATVEQHTHTIGILSGLGWLFGVFGLWALWKNRRPPRRKRNAHAYF